MGLNQVVRSFWKRGSKPPSRRSAGPRRGVWHPQLEILEDRTMLSASALGADLFVPLANSAPAVAAAATPGTSSPSVSAMPGPVSLTGFSVAHHQLFASGNTTLPGGLVVPFTTTAAVQNQTTSNSCTILALTLGPVDLNLLGLAVHLDQVNLLVRAQPGPGQLLGNLLCPQHGGHTNLHLLSRALNDLLAGGGAAAGVLPLNIGLGNSATDLAPYQALNQQLTTAGVQAGDMACPVLDLSIQNLELNLLGLDVKSENPIHLTINAIPGPGNLLGNLFCQLSHLLDNPGTPTPVGGSVLSQILSVLTGTLLSGLTGGTAGAASTASPMAADAAPMAGAGNQQSMNSCQILFLDLGPIHLNLLGLVVDLSEVKLLITAQPGPGNLLGNLLCGPGGLTRLLSNLTQGLGLAGPLNTGAAPAAAPLAGINLGDILDQIAAGTVAAPMGPCTILDLTIPPIYLDLLGLVVQTQTTIHLTITAVPGPGNLLGNLLCDVAGLLDNPTPATAA